MTRTFTRLVFIDSFGNERSGILRREKVGDFLLADDFGGKRWILLPEEVISREEIILPEGEDGQEGPPRHRRRKTRKLG